MALIKTLLPAALLCALTPALHAQLPTDNLAWKARCEALTTSSHAVETGTITPQLAAMTRGVSGTDFTMVALDRSHEGQHAVACTLFYLAAIAERSGSAGHEVRPFAAQNRLILAQAETQELRKESVSMTVQVRRMGVQARHLLVTTPTAVQVQAVLTAASTLALPVTTASR